jgi:hypothetical protein
MEADNPATISMEMVFFEGGTFKMGSNDGEDREKPIHKSYGEAVASLQFMNILKRVRSLAKLFSMVVL